MTSKNLWYSTQHTNFKAFFCIVLSLGLMLVIAVSATGAGDTDTDAVVSEKRTDIIVIDTMKAFGELEEPVVHFYHDRHTESIVKKQKDCQQCHQLEKNRLSLKFMQTGNAGKKQEAMEIYHSNCIGCHENTIDGKGPVTCRECHAKKPVDTSGMTVINFDKSLHFRHTESLNNDCSKCHHEYDKKTEKLIYKKGQESSCAYCHNETQEEKKVSAKDAAHNSCVVCHLSMIEKEQAAGPVNCAGCHDIKKVMQVEKIKNPPRLMRKQPDTVLMKTGNQEIDDVSKNRMNFVSFNHKTHEESNDNCKTCHHKSLSSCTSCHSLTGKKEGGGVSLEKAMHYPNAEQSCAGCHNMKKQDKNCLGCHAFIPEKTGNADNTCTVCHNNRLEVIDKKIDGVTEPLSGVSSSDVPEKVIIKKLADEYKAVNFPHGKIIASLEKKIKESQLATSFHTENGLLCSGCHHKLPVTKNPSACSTCHDAAQKEKLSGKPGLMAAYHIQCMECHDNMKIGKTGCTDCHEKK